MLCSYERWNFSTENGRGNPTACGKAPQMYKVTTPWCIMEHDIFVHGGATEEKVPLDQKAACLLTDPCGISPSSHSTSPPTSQATCLTPEASTSGKPHILLSLDKHLDREQLHTKAMLVLTMGFGVRCNGRQTLYGHTNPLSSFSTLCLDLHACMAVDTYTYLCYARGIPVLRDVRVGSHSLLQGILKS